MKLYQILIGIVVLGLISSALYSFISAGVNSMDDPSSAGVDDQILQDFKTERENAKSYESFLNNQSADADSDNRQDILGAIFARGYQQARSGEITSNLDSYSNLVNKGTNELGFLGKFADDLNVALASILAITIGVGIFLYFIIGKERV